MRKRTRKVPRTKKANDIFKQRLQYVCELLFGGHYTNFADAAGYKNNKTWFGRLVYYEAQVTAKALAKLAQTGLVNAEYLLCGTGPACSPPREDAPGALNLPAVLSTTFKYFDTAAVQFATEFYRPPRAIDVTDHAPLGLARAIYKARGADKPVILYLAESAMFDGVGAAVAQMLRKQYVTAVVCTTAAAYRDVEFARYGGFASAGFDNNLIDINEAALMAANNGIGYGEAIGRWCFPKDARRETSVIATAYELGTPVIVRAAFGDSLNHWFPSKRGAELGAAIGAASYADMLIFAEQLRQCVNARDNSGVFIPTEEDGVDFLQLARAAFESDSETTDVNIVSSFDMLTISGEQRRTFPALLTACDAVYDGSADNGKRSCRV